MIVGLGIDIIEVSRMKRTIERYEKRFLNHVFADSEQDEAPAGAGMASYYAGRWAAKEAVAKALGTGIGERCGWHDVRVVRGTLGKPMIELHGAAAATAADQGIEHVHISISHERHLACASAVAEATETSKKKIGL